MPVATVDGEHLQNLPSTSRAKPSSAPKVHANDAKGKILIFCIWTLEFLVGGGTLRFSLLKSVISFLPEIQEMFE